MSNLPSEEARAEHTSADFHRRIMYGEKRTHQGKTIGLLSVCVLRLILCSLTYEIGNIVLKATVILGLTQELPHNVFLFFISGFRYYFSPSDQLFPPSNCFKIGTKK